MQRWSEIARSRTTRTLLALGLIGRAAPAAAQVSHPPVVARDESARVERLAEGVFAIIHDDATRNWPSGSTAWPHGNTGVIVGDQAVLVVDATYLPSRAQADIALIRRLTDRPIRYLVNTHWHGDHTHGNGVYRAAFPDLTIIGARANQSFIAINQERRSHAVPAADGPTRAGVKSMDSVLASGRDSTGRPLSAEDIARLKRYLADWRREIEEMATVAVAPPTLLFEGTLRLPLGGRVVELTDRGAANSPHDVTAYLPAERILFTGDIVVHPVPYAFGASPVPWIEVLRQIEATPVTALVPGHGPVMAGHEYTRLIRELFEATRDRVLVLVRQGLPNAAIMAAVNLDDFRSRFVLAGDVSAAEGWDESIKAGLVRTMIPCVSGSTC